jgi:hypothetical protein
MKNIFQEWSNFSEDVYASFTLNKRLSDYFMEFAQVRQVRSSIIYTTNLKQDLLEEQKNVYLATAVGLGLWLGGFNSSPKWLKVWAMIIPEGNFAGCKPFMEKNDCLPYFPTKMTSSDFATVSRFFMYLAKQQEVEQNMCERSGVKIAQNTALGEQAVCESISESWPRNIWSYYF